MSENHGHGSACDTLAGYLGRLRAVRSTGYGVRAPEMGGLGPASDLLQPGRTRRIGRSVLVGLMVLLFTIEAAAGVVFPELLSHAAGVAIASVAVLPLHVHHVLSAIDGRRPRHGVATLAAAGAVTCSPFTSSESRGV